MKDSVEYALQEPQLGTGHAAMQAEMLKEEKGDTIILCGDGPCIQSETILKVFEANKDHACSVVTAELEDGARYGRIVRNEKNLVEKIVEAKENSQALRNIEALSEGENTPSIDCTVDVGRSIKNGIITYGMSLKHENHEKTY